MGNKNDWKVQAFEFTPFGHWAGFVHMMKGYRA